MGLEAINLFTDAALSHDGTGDSGKGVCLGGPDGPNPGLPDWYQYGNPHSGWTSPPVDGWAHGGYLFLVYNGTNGLGRGIYRYTQNQITGALTAAGFVAIADTGLVGDNWGRGCAQYDSSDGSVILISYPKAGAANTPIVGKWLCSSWTEVEGFTAANAEWLSPLEQSYGSYVAGKLTNKPYPYLGANYLFVSNNYSGQVFTVDPSDGSVLGTWVFAEVYHIANSFKFLGENAAGQPVGGSYHTSGGNRAIHKWNISNLSAWTSAGPLLGVAYAQVYAPNYKRGGENLYGQNYFTQPLSESEKDLLGLIGCVYWQNVRYSVQSSELFLVHYDPDADTYREIPFAQDSGRRAMSNYRFTHDNPSVCRFVSVGGIPWFVGWNIATADIENDNPGGRSDRQIGLIISAVGPGTVKYTMIAGVGGVPSEGTPKMFTIGVDPSAKNYLFSEHRAKHELQMEVAGGGKTGWRSGEQALSNLDSMIGGDPAWPGWTDGQMIEIWERIYAGWPHAIDTSIVRNPGEAGDPAVETVGTADAAPPREVVVKLWYEPAPLSDEGKMYGRAGGGRAINLRPGGGVATVG